ncbi:hypothetical protein BS47DRAFT_1366410 [Hydnum rufescens UP504]|uniref:Secreted protein n=1 Tax=Hydnum rufescens UP504 TaxID=1448309 RepID=A0A9P6AM37_9AGAM|nr:hypothetical protein BS47DRAFT_1366410 [Hydnum rufescens UP504]
MPKEQLALLFWRCLLSFFYLLICSYSRDTSTSQYLTRQTNRQARGETQEHAQPPKPPSSICNIDADETNMVPHARFSGCVALLDTSTLQYPTRRTNRQPGRNTAARAATQDPPPQPSATYMPTTKYGATHPLQRVCGTLRYLHLAIPHPMNEQTGPGQNTAARAATPRRFDYLQHMRRRSKCSATHPLWRLHPMIPHPPHEQTGPRAKHGSTRSHPSPPSTITTYMLTKQIRRHIPASADLDLLGWLPLRRKGPKRVCPVGSSY